MGTYSQDRQPKLDELLIEPARQSDSARMVVAGPQYPNSIEWPQNVQRIEHLPPAEHAEFYCSQRFTLNITRADMIAAGYSPSVRLFEAAACGVPIISDSWTGLDSFFKPGDEILICDNAADVIDALNSTSDNEQRMMGQRARSRVLAEHTAAHRAREFQDHVCEASELKSRSRKQDQ